VIATPDEVLTPFVLVRLTGRLDWKRAFPSPREDSAVAAGASTDWRQA
jgi:hypothetical protein